MEDRALYKNLLPITVEVEAGKEYFWCSCGESQTQPFCDKKCCGEKAVSFVSTLSEEITFCNCKHTKTPPFCDGSHAKFLIDILKNRKLK